MVEEEFEFENYDLEDFDLTQATYQVWVFGYNHFHEITDFEFLIGEYNNPKDAIDRAKSLITGISLTDSAKRNIPDKVEFLTVEVETVVELEEGATQNVGTIFMEVLQQIK